MHCTGFEVAFQISPAQSVFDMIQKRFLCCLWCNSYSPAALQKAEKHTEHS